jgi:hypothetical protein
MSASSSGYHHHYYYCLLKPEYVSVLHDQSKVFRFGFEIGSQHVAQTGLELEILL